MVVSTARAMANVDPTLSRVGTMLGMGRVAARAARAPARGRADASPAPRGRPPRIGWIAVVAAEYIGASAGLGLMITNAATSLATPVVIAGMIVIGAGRRRRERADRLAVARAARLPMTPTRDDSGPRTSRMRQRTGGGVDPARARRRARVDHVFHDYVAAGVAPTC